MGEWFKDWFSSDFYLSVYSHRNDEDAEKFLNKILSYISVEPGSNVLDAACGAGRHSIFMAKKNYNVTGFDLSLPLLEVARKKSAGLNLNIEFRQEDLRYAKFDLKFPLILNLFTSFGYFSSDEENFSFIKSAYGMQEKGGYFIFDFLNEGYLRKNLVPKSQKEVNGLTVIEEREIKNNRIVKNITIKKEEDSINYEESVQLYSFNSIIERFNETGYKVLRIFGSYGCGEFSAEESERLIIIFQK